MYTILYARAQNGKIKVWRAEDTGNGIRTLYGYYGGNLAVHISKITMKSSHGQLLSMIKAKKKDGYKDVNDIIINVNNIEHLPTSNLPTATLIKPNTITKEWLNTWLPKTNLDANYNLKPMKCQPFKRNKFKYPAIAQPKLNGVRGVLRWEILTAGEGAFKTTAETAVIRSKSGLIYHLPHITDVMVKSDFIDKNTGLEVAYDGELYLHNTSLNMINSACPLINNRGTISKTKYPHITPQIKFVIFDISNEDLAQSNRTNIVGNIPPMIGTDTVKDTIVYSDEEAMTFAMQCITDGYEGAVIRDMDAEYKFGSRPMSMMKIKKFYDAEFKVIDIIPKPRESTTAMFVLRNDINDASFECNPMGSYAERKSYLDNKESYIGKMATVKFAERSGVKSVPFHANVVTIRPKHDM